VKESAFPKFGTQLDVSIAAKSMSVDKKLNNYLSEGPKKALAFHGFGRYWRKCITEKLSDNYQEFEISKKMAPFSLCVLNSQFAYWYWIVSSDCYRFTKTDALNIPVPTAAIDDQYQKLSLELLKSYEEHSEIQVKTARNGMEVSEKQYFPQKSKPIIDAIDRVLAQHYGFTEDELDFIINYDIKYRVGKENAEEV
jgi:hypothetical protein